MVIVVLKKKETDLKTETSSIVPFPDWLKSLHIHNSGPFSLSRSGIFIQLQLEKGDFQSTSWKDYCFL